jgi:aerobic-type carbon monoxide dehydrogenase small subunit (CoxS/CutS family)
VCSFSDTTERAVEGRSAEQPALSTIALRVNGQRHELVVGRDFWSGASLAEVLRECLGLTGVKVACDQGACGACTVIMDKRPVLSCMVLAAQSDGADILTVEGLAADDPLIVAFATESQPGHGTAIQCGFCTPGMILAAKALLLRVARPTPEQVVAALAGNICRCGCYAGIVDAVVKAGEAAEPSRAGANDEPERAGASGEPERAGEPSRTPTR